MHKQRLWDHHSSLNLRRMHFSLHASNSYEDENLWTEPNEPAVQIGDRKTERVLNNISYH